MCGESAHNGLRDSEGCQRVTREEENHNTFEPAEPEPAPDTEDAMAPGSDVDAWLADDTIIATRDDEPDSTGTDSEGAESERPSADDSEITAAEPDVVSAWLLRVALALIIVVLVTSASLVIFFISAEKAPRTAVERDLAAAEIAVRERSSNPGAWRALAYAYVRAGRFDDAIEVSRRGRTATGAKALLLSEADALRAAGRHKDAIAVYDEAVAALSEEASAAIAAREKQGIVTPSSNASLVTAFYGRGLSRGETGDAKGAIADVERALEFSPQQSALWASLGELYEKTGETAKAEAAYREALRFIPDYPAALLGLKRLEKRP